MKIPEHGLCLLMAATGLGIFPASAATPAEIRWNELAALIVGHRVSIPLPGGAVVEGEALSVRDDALMLDIGKASDSSRYPRGQTPLPRVSVTEIRVAEHRGIGGRILGSAIGALAGMGAGAEIAVHGTHSVGAGVSAFTATAIACTVGGFFAGRGADRHTRLLRIVPAAGEGAR
jgi:hypothetical protein